MQPYFCMWQLQDHCWHNTRNLYLYLKYSIIKNWKGLSQKKQGCLQVLNQLQ